MADFVILICPVYGDPSSLGFEVETNKGKTVSFLKEFVKEKTEPEFDHISANRLDLWKASIPEENLRILFSLNTWPIFQAGRSISESLRNKVLKFYIVPFWYRHFPKTKAVGRNVIKFRPVFSLTNSFRKETVFPLFISTLKSKAQRLAVHQADKNNKIGH
jgi:hypothetical protein